MSNLISICIPSFNRPETLSELLNSINTKYTDDVEIIICEDLSPRRSEIREIIKEYKKRNNYSVKYFENEVNLGYDKNLRELISKAKNEYVMFMGDDDMYIESSLDKYIEFLRKNIHLGYILKNHIKVYENGIKEEYNYYKGNKFFEPGFNTYKELFRKSIPISGFTIKRELCIPLSTDIFDGTLLYQIYILGEVVLKYPSCYFDEPLTISLPKGTVPFFGMADSETGLYKPGEITLENSINFMNGYFKITKYFDDKYGYDLTDFIRKEVSKYSLRVLSVQREKGLKLFYKYVSLLKKQLGLGITINFYIYVLFLTIFGVKLSDRLIVFVKKVYGKTPRL